MRHPRQRYAEVYAEVNCIFFLVGIIPHSGYMTGLQGRAPGAPTAAVIAAHRSYMLSGWACVQKYLSVLADNNGVLPVPSNTWVPR